MGVRSSSGTLTNPSSLRPMSSVSRMDGRTPRRRLRTDLLFLMIPRMPSLAMLRTVRPLPLTLKLLRKRSRRSRRSSTLMLPMLISRRDRISSRRLMMESMVFSSLLTTTTTPCASPFQDKKKALAKEIKAVEEKLEVVGRFKSTVGKIEELVAALTAFDNSLKTLDGWKDAATAELKDIKEASGNMLPEDRVARTMDLQEDIAAKLEILKANAETELNLLPQGDKVPADAQAFKDELKRITDYVKKLQADTKVECDKYSNDVKYWAEYRTGIKEFKPWLEGAEKSAAEGLAKQSDLDQVKALDEKVKTFEKACVNYLKVLDSAKAAAQKMTTHAEADAEVAGLKERYDKVKSVSDTWVKKVDVLVKEWVLLDNTVTELNSWVAKDKSAEGENQFSLEKMESTLGELKNIFKQKEKLVEGL